MTTGTLVLRRSLGPFSAGTRLIVHSDNPRDATMTVEPRIREGFVPVDEMVFDCDYEDMQELRNRVDLVPAENRAQRRAVRRKEMEVLNLLINKGKT